MTTQYHPSSTDSSIMTGSDITTSVHSADLSATNLIASDFWTALSEEVSGLREIIESPTDDIEEEDHEIETKMCDASTVVGTATLLFPQVDLELIFNDDKQDPLFNLHAQNILLHLYRIRVDSVYKLLHWPSVVSMFQEKRSQCTTTITSQRLSVDALENSIYFMSICSVSVTEAKEMGMGDRNTLLKIYRARLETLFARSDLLNSADITLLQAFVIYLIGLRACSNGAYTWTLVAVAVRLATALKLGDENTTAHTHFEIQLRRRLLFGIGILDTHSALDRGTIPILPSTAFTVPPLSIDDASMSPPNNVPKESDTGITDMSHTVMIYEAMLCQRRLYELSEASPDSWDIWHRKLELIISFEKYVRRTTSHVQESSAPIDKLLKISGQKILTSLQLLLRRPPYRQSRNSVPPWDDFDVSKAATNVLKQHLQPLTPELEPWAWKNWIQWHALAVVLAELATNSNGEEADRAYVIAKKSFDYYARIVADSESGMLWKPISKLMRRVELLRRNKSSTTIPNFSEFNASTNSQVNGKPMILTSLVDDFSFDTSSWMASGHEMELSEVYNNFCDHEHTGESNMSWLSWDAFLQDMSIEDT